jgi:transcription antitermination factor NusG
MLLAPGTNVRIAEGLLSGIEGVFERDAGDERVVILLDLLGQAVPVRVSRGVVLSSRTG